MSLLGVYNINKMTECTKVLPQAKPGPFNPPDQWYIDQWLQTTKQISTIAQALMDGTLLTDLLSVITGLLGLLR